jgi:predicted Zn-dependent protease
MRNIFLKFLLMMGLFLGSWFVLSQIDFMKLLNVEELSTNAEKEVGDFVWEYFHPQKEEVKNKIVKEQLDSLLNILCINNQLNPDDYSIHIIREGEPNAFALPANRIIFHHSLILNCSKPEEYCAVLAHEIAHIKHNHVIKKLRQELGISVLLSISKNGMGSSIGRQIIGLLSGNAYSRKYEREADKTAVDLLINAKIDPVHFTHILNRISSKDNDQLTHSEWLSTHPDTKKRCRTILQLRDKKGSISFQDIAMKKWTLIQELLKSEPTIN